MTSGPDRSPPITVFTFFLALPFVIPVPDKLNPGFLEERTAAWDGWSATQLGTLIEQTQALPPDAIPGTRIAIRHHEASLVIPFVAVFDAFLDWIKPALSEEEFGRLSSDTDAHRNSPIEVVKTIAALSRYVPRTEHPPTGAVSIGWLLDLFREALVDFNKLLETLGLVMRRSDLGALAPRVLPPLVPSLVESSHPNDDGDRMGTTSIVPLHNAAPMPAHLFEPQLEDFDKALALNNAASHGGQPFMLAFRLIHAAEAERLSGDPTRAVIDLNTAIEVLVSATLTEGGRLAGWSEKEISAAIGWRTGFKQRIEKYLSHLTEFPIDLNDDDSAWGRWYTGGYRSRNAAVHEGQRLSKLDVDGALRESGEVVDELRSQLQRSSTLRPLGEKLSYAVGVNPEWEAKLAPLQFPWD